MKKKWTLRGCFLKKAKDFSVKTMIHIHRLFKEYGYEEVFGRSTIMELLELKASGASKLISNLVQADIISRYPVMEKEDTSLKSSNKSENEKKGSTT